MARSRIGIDMSISELEKLVATRKSQLDRLFKRRKGLLGEINEVDEQIRRLKGSNHVALNGSRARNSMTLVDAISKVLSGTNQPMSVADILAGVIKAGYQSHSDKFRAIVNQTLIKEKKRFIKAGWGMYQLKN